MFPDNLGLIAPERLALYLHIPFCSRKCGYCDFYSIPHPSRPLIEKTLDATLTSLAQAMTLIGSGRRIPVATAYIGGGTPSILSADQLKRLLEAVLDAAGGAPDEMTVELNPESVTPQGLDVLEANGVSRVSLGIQSMNREVLGYLDRMATPEANRNALETVRERFSGDLSVDLIAGVPGRAEHAIARELEELLSFRPEHLSCYTLTIEPDTPLSERIRSGTAVSPDEDQQLGEWLEAVEILETRGYVWYEISNFAQPGHESAHNLTYWRMDPYLGVGPGAVSTLPSERGAVRIEAGHELPDPVYATELLSAEELFLEHLLMGLRTAEGLSRKRVFDRFGLDPVNAAEMSITAACEDGFLDIDDTAIRATREGRLVLDSVIGAIASELEGTTPPRCEWGSAHEKSQLRCRAST